MSLLSKLFGLGGGGGQGARPAKQAPEQVQAYEGFEIRATPYQEEGRWQLCGVIAKEIAGEKREHRFIRADRFATADEAADMVFFKARMMIDLMGERLFD